MLKPLTLSLSLAVALGVCSVSKAGGLDSNCTTCGLASPQGGPYASAQGGVAACEPACAPKKHCFSFHLPKIHCNLPKIQHTCSYEWVLKKKHCWSIVHNKPAPCGGAPVYATGQGGVAPSGQGGAAPSGQYCSSRGLRRWSARVPACQAGDLDRVGSGRDDLRHSGRRRSPARPSGSRDVGDRLPHGRAAPAHAFGQLSGALPIG